VGARVEELAEAQKQTEANLSTLTIIVAELGRAQTRTEQSLTKLSEAQAHTDQRLDALVDIIQGRNGQ
jgi:ABC-type transporter Mla subunit MlaD